MKENNTELFDSYRIIPNIEGRGFFRSVLKKTYKFNDAFFKFAKGFLPDSVATWVHPAVQELINFDCFGIKEAKEAISNKASEYLDKFIDASKKTIEKKSVCWDEILLDEEQYKLILDYLKLFIQDTSDSFLSRTYCQLIDFYNYENSVTEKIDNGFDYRQLLRLIINDTFAKFSLLSSSERERKEQCIYQIIGELYTYRDFSDMLRYYPVYKNQNDEFVYYNTIQIEDEIPEQLKDYYDQIVLKKQESSIRSKLVDSTYSKILIEGSYLNGSKLASEISQKIQISPYPKIGESEFKNIIVEIVTKHCENSQNGDLWKRLFDKIYADRAMLLLSIIESPSKKESLSRLMTIDDDEKLKDVIDLLDTDDFSEIIRLGKEALMTKIRNENDSQYKKMLGSYVEDWISDKLKEELEDNEIKCEATIDNEQGGQDLIIRLNGKPIYYMEIKSRWNNRDSVQMSKMQMEVSADKKDCYALCAVDMTNFAHSKAEHHEYPNPAETISRIFVSKQIGEDNFNILNGLVTDERLVHLGGDYKSVVPQSYLNKVGISFEDLITVIIDRIRDEISASEQM